VSSSDWKSADVPTGDRATLEVQEILFTAEQIRERVRELAAEISRDYAGRPVHLVVVLRGAAVFAADLIRELSVPASVDYIAISSYRSGRQSSGTVRIIKDLEDNIESQYVIVVEDIIDTGLTLNYLSDLLRGRKVASLEVCALLDKPSARKAPAQAKYVGFTVPEAFVVGYGLDFDQQYRGLPYIATLRPDAEPGS